MHVDYDLYPTQRIIIKKWIQNFPLKWAGFWVPKAIVFFFRDA